MVAANWRGCDVAGLYAALNDDQKRTADEIMLGPMGMMI
jgi:hypothetical protein